MKKATAIIAGLAISTMIGFTAHATYEGFTDSGKFQSWYSDAAQEMRDSGVITGYEDGSFGPGNNINRAELAVMFARFAKKLGVDLNPKPMACTMEFREGMKIFLFDQHGDPVEDATITATAKFRAPAQDGSGSTMDEVTSFNSAEPGVYTGLGEGKGLYEIKIEKDGYVPHMESVDLRHDECHVVPQTWTRMLIQKM